MSSLPGHAPRGHDMPEDDGDQREQEHHGQPPRPDVVESRLAAHRPDAHGAVQQVRPPGPAGQRPGADVRAADGRRVEATIATSCGSGPGRAIRSTACSSRPSPWSARRPSGRSASGISTSSSSAASPIHNRCIAELETGEGKTLVATLPAFLNALPGKGVHVVTVNDYLAQRDAEWMTPIYNLLGMTVGCIQTGQPDGVAPRRLRLRHHLRDQQGVRLRLPPRRAEAAPARRHPPQVVRAGLPGQRRPRRVGDARPAHPPLRDRRRGRQHPDRRGPDAADHRGQQPADPGRGRRLLRRRPARRDPRPGQGLTSTTRSSGRPS